ncbi:Uncharacterised protein [Mycobacteroides abscessus subsp. abscessus]|nr:Uncharacterised protein [Mycobacteroides abscessus subsp. abscessus]
MTRNMLVLVMAKKIWMKTRSVDTLNFLRQRMQNWPTWDFLIPVMRIYLKIL